MAIIAIVCLPKLNNNNSYKSIVEFQDYITVKGKENKEVRYYVVPKVKFYIFTFLALGVMVVLGVATILGFSKPLLWSWVSFSLLSIFNTFYLTEKRTLWTKAALGIIIGIICILTILLSIVLFAQILSKLISI